MTTPIRNHPQPSVDTQLARMERTCARMRWFVCTLAAVLVIGVLTLTAFTVAARANSTSTDACRAATHAARTLNDSWHRWKESARTGLADNGEPDKDLMGKTATGVHHAQDAFVDLAAECLDDQPTDAQAGAR